MKEMLTSHNKLLNRIYEVRQFEGKQEILYNFREWTEQHIGPVCDVENQIILSIKNKFTLEHTIFNELRSKRPDDTKTPFNVDILDDNEGCLFCSPEENTPNDLFGSIKGKYCMTCSNIAKFDKYHGLVIFREHNPLKLNKSWLTDYFDVCDKWFDAADIYDGKILNRYVFWNSLWRAAASINHGHIQLTASELKYGRIESIELGMSNYNRHKTWSYFDDIITTHKQLHLEVTNNDDNILFYLTPIKEKEIVIISNANRLKDIASTSYKVIEFFRKMGVQSFNLIAHKIFDRYIIRIVDRGSLDTKHSDYGVAEVYAVAIVMSDPFRLRRQWKAEYDQ